MAVIAVGQHIALIVANPAAEPVHILQNTLGIVLGPVAQILLVLVVPELRQLVHIRFAVIVELLQLIAQDDVQVVGQLVGIEPQGPTVDGVEVLIEFLGSGVFQQGETLLRHGKDVLPERKAPAHEILKEPGLALIKAPRGAPGQGGALQLRR